MLKDEIMKISEKWEKRTAKSGTIWPVGGTFDAVMCRDMEVMIKNHKPNRSGKKAVEKREREKLVLALFQKEGERWRKEERAAREIKKDEKTETLTPKGQPPPYNTGLYPLITFNIYRA